MNIYIVNGACCCGKSTYIKSHKKEKDITIDMYDYQKCVRLNSRTILSAFYNFLSDLEYICRNAEQDIWIECVVSTRERLNLILDTIYAGFNNKIGKNRPNIKMIHLRSDKNNLFLMQQFRESDNNLETNSNIAETTYNSQDAIRDLMCSVEYRNYDIEYIFYEYE